MDSQRPPPEGPAPPSSRHERTREERLAHDLRNAVARIVGRAQLLARHVRTAEDVSPGRLLAGLAEIERSAKAIVDYLAALEDGGDPPAPQRQPRPVPPVLGDAPADGRGGHEGSP
jgi:hypothetical protein